MSVDVFQEKIRKLKNPSMVELLAAPGDLPPHILEEEGSAPKGYGRFCQELLTGLKGLVPGVRFSFAAFALLGPEGLEVLSEALKTASGLGYYVVLDAPELLSPRTAEFAAQAIFGGNSRFPCDGVIISAYPGSDMIKPFLLYCREGKKDLFIAVRTANKSAPELQDLLTGSRLVHTAAADYVNRYGGETVGKSGYSRVGILAAATSAGSLRTLRSGYPKLFLLVDGYDYPSSSAKNCASAFDRFGHGAAVCAGSTITGAWRQAGSDGRDYADQAAAAAERMKKNLTRHVTVL